MQASTLVYLIRHGETPLNASRVLQHPDTPLSENGLAQARALASRLASNGLPSVGRIVSSDYARARSTAEAIAHATGIAIEEEPLLRERNFGDWRGRRYDEIDFDPIARGLDPPGGENEAVFEERTTRAWERVSVLASSEPAALVVVTHGLVCQAIIGRLRAPASEPVHIANTGLTVLESGRGGGWDFERIGCTRHLEEGR